MGIEVYKFGGASIKDSDSMENVCAILKANGDKNLMTIVSATGKTTNALEKVVDAYFYGSDDAFEILEKIKKDHFDILISLGLTEEAIMAEISDTFIEIEWMIEEEVQDEYNYIYDQIVSVGELISSKILYYLCIKNGLKAYWLDVRDVLLTDNTYREAKVLWEETKVRMTNKVKPLLDAYEVVISQGFIGSSTENFNTTLGREGSDFSAAIFSYCLDASKMTIWKDVPGILTGDPSVFNDVSLIEKLDYREAIEMTYYGAKVIHPKTIKPLQNNSISLFVRPFNDLSQEGTEISSEKVSSYPPVIVLEADQSLIHIKTKDFSFVAEEHLSEIFDQLNACRLKVNMMRNTAISFSVSVQNNEEKIKRFVEAMRENYQIIVREGLQLITIRHYDEASVEKMKKGREVIFEETISETLRMVVTS